MAKLPAAANSLRRADVDFLRASAVSLVLVVHAAQIFSPWQTWHVQNAERSKLLAELTLFAGPWLMALFMMLAGRSAFHSLTHRDNRHYLKERVVRILVPLIAGTLLLGPPQMYARRVHEDRFDGSFLDFVPHFFNGLSPDGNFSWGHLWFLAYLFVYGCLSLPLLRWLRPRFRSWPAQSWTVATVLVFVAILAGLQVALRAPFPQTNAFVGDWANHAQLFPAFLLGYAYAADERLRLLLARVRFLTLCTALGASAAIAVHAWPGNFGDRLPGEYSMTYALFWTIATTATWAWLFAITSWAGIRIRKPVGILTWSRQIVYAFYILHQPVLVYVAWLVVPGHSPIVAEYFLVLFAAFAVTLILCELLRHLRLGRWLIGIKPLRA